MKMKFGFELEGFFTGTSQSVTLPPKDYPRDGFPGLVEVRTVGGKDLPDAVMELMTEVYKYPGVDYSKHEFTFTPEQRSKLRQLHSGAKTPVNVRNLYDSKPRHTGNRSLASLQVNFSNLITEGHWGNPAKKKYWSLPNYGLLDVPTIVRTMDKEFAAEIKASGRQAGVYAVKDGFRLEYRSLPNSVIVDETSKVTLESLHKFQSRLEKALAGIL